MLHPRFISTMRADALETFPLTYKRPENGD
jgi:hypothetical protein